MSTPFSKTHASFRMQAYTPLRPLGWVVAGWFVLLIFWSVVATVNVTVDSDAVTVMMDGFISAEFSPDLPLKVGQEGYIQLVGQQSDVLPAIVLQVDTGTVLLEPVTAENRLRLIRGRTPIDQVKVIVAQRSPLDIFLSGGQP
ncbi:MAG: hypothetical protein R3C62_18330 [Chloroflexota bacterium]